MSRIAKRRAKIWNETICPAIEFAANIIGGLFCGAAVAFLVWVMWFLFG